MNEWQHSPGHESIGAGFGARPIFKQQGKMMMTNRVYGIVLAACLVMAGQVWGEAMRLVVSSPLDKVLRNREVVAAGDEMRIDGAGGETISAQAVLLPGSQSDTVMPRITALKLVNGTATIPTDAVRLQWVRYKAITFNTPNIPDDELVAKAPAEIPDPFWEDITLETKPGQLQPLWLEFAIPLNTPPGEYRGELVIAGRTGKTSLPIVARIRRFTLTPEPHQHVIQWWGVPGRTFEHLQPGTPEYWQHFENMCQLVQRHRQTDIWVPRDLIVSAKDGSGEQAWDTTMAEQAVEIAFGTGLRATHFQFVARISHDMDDPRGRVVIDKDRISRLAALQQMTVRRNWQGRIFVGVTDEPHIYHEASYARALAEIRKAAPDVGIIDALESDQIRGLDIYVPKLSHLNLWWPGFQELKQQGETVWFYTCCHPTGRYPNRFLDQPLISPRQLHWISYLYGLDGYLHWGFNWFAEEGDPYSEQGSMPSYLPPGDSQVAYPAKKGFVGSLRLSAMRDGLQDYEYLWTLEQRLRLLKTQLADDGTWLDPCQRPRELCNRVVYSFYERTRDPAVLLATRAAIADEIEALERSPLLYVQTAPPEGTFVPPGPIMINVRGVATPGAKITINGTAVIPENITTNGYFLDKVFSGGNKVEVIVEAEWNGRKLVQKRSFKSVE
jgi:hypothetical protein